MQKLNRDIGSSFYKLFDDDFEYHALKSNTVDFNFEYDIYYSGRNAILALLKKIEKSQSIETIWLPEYYCDTVTNLLNKNFKSVKRYALNPFEFDSKPNIEDFANKNDVVFLNNFWGLSSFNYKLNKIERPIIIEDHSHGWLSKQSLQSQADYCICSLRKTYPIPLGAIVWKPSSDKSLNFYEDTTDVNIQEAFRKFSKSMELKRHFIKEHNQNVKSDYLAIVNEGESLLSNSNNYTKPKQDFFELIEPFIHLDPNLIKKNHLNYAFKNLEESEHFKIIKREGYTPFGLLALFKNEKMFLSFKQHLIHYNIYPAHLWPHNNLASKWKYLYNIHVDFRYNIEDIGYLVEKINIWSKNNV